MRTFAKFYILIYLSNTSKVSVVKGGIPRLLTTNHLLCEFFLTMSRPSRHGPKAQSQTYPVDKSGPNSTDAAAAAGLNKARAQFNAPLSQLLAIFPDWKDDDLVSVLEEVRGDVELAVARISEGMW